MKTNEEFFLESYTACCGFQTTDHILLNPATVICNIYYAQM